jgi:hypothetical protein
MYFVYNRFHWCSIINVFKGLDKIRFYVTITFCQSSGLGEIPYRRLRRKRTPTHPFGLGVRARKCTPTHPFGLGVRAESAHRRLAYSAG